MLIGEGLTGPAFPESTSIHIRSDQEGQELEQQLSKLEMHLEPHCFSCLSTRICSFYHWCGGIVYKIPSAFRIDLFL
ncbi:hypothetical protein JHK82_048040 [Glycine max]|nr:hypothetical protein JHK82_048040 [Glycine max]